MPRKPAQLVGGKGPRQRVWEAIRLLHKRDEPFTELDIWAKTDNVYGDIEKTLVREYRRSLLAAGILAEVKKAQGRISPTYRLVTDEGIDAPRVSRDGKRITGGLAQEQMWRTLRILKGDTNARELAAHASTPAIVVAVSTAINYLYNLHQSGFLTPTEKLPSKANTLARYRLTPSHNTGPRAPMVCRTRVIYDPNTDTTHTIERVSEEVAIYGK